MKTVLHKILVAILYLFFINNYGQNSVQKFCYNSVDKDEIKTELRIEIYEDSTYNLKSQILSSPKYGEVKTINNETSGKIIQKNGNSYLKQNNSENENSEYEIKLKKNKLIIIGNKKKRKFLSNKYDYVKAKGIIFTKKNCG